MSSTSIGTKTLWDSIDVALPALPYKEARLLQQDKGSTKWAAHSHTPCSVSRWDDFDNFIVQASQKPVNMASFSVNVEGELNGVNLKKVSREQHVTNNIDNLLQAALKDALPNIEFAQTDEYTMASPDLVALREQGRLITSNQYESPANRVKARAAATEELKQAPMFTFETKPFWKFRFLLDAQDSTQLLIDLWSVPRTYKANAPLPKGWSSEKGKVFHLIRQLYGQMKSSKLSYGIVLLYDIWWFCRRDEDGDLKISRPFRKEETAPSVLQAIVTMAGFDDLKVEMATAHPQSAVKTRDSKPKVGGGSEKRMRDDSGKDTQSGGGGGRTSLPTKHGGRDSYQAEISDTEFASLVNAWECDLVDMTDHVKLLVNNKFPNVLIKLQRDPSEEYVALEMEREANIYLGLSKRTITKKAITQFYGYSDHLGVSLLCTKREGADFEDIGVENLSLDLKMSAVESVRLLSQAGLLHNDLALRNVVQCRADPKQAKIIDFGRAEFTEDQQLLEEQIHHIQQLLRVGSSAESACAC
jgi:hypothetical protein